MFMKTKDRGRNQPPPTLLIEGEELPAPLLRRRGVGERDFAIFADFAPWRETGFFDNESGGTKPECI
jgi:hypothetical protein